MTRNQKRALTDYVTACERLAELMREGYKFDVSHTDLAVALTSYYGEKDKLCERFPSVLSEAAMSKINETVNG